MLIQECFLHGRLSNWNEVCQWVDNAFPDDVDGVDEALMEDFSWYVLQSKLIWSMRLACQLAIQDVREDVALEELHILTFFANHAQTKRLEPPKWQLRSYPIDASIQSQHLRKLRNRLGKLLELKTIILKRGFNKVALDLTRRIFGKKRQSTTISELDKEITQVQSELNMVERDAKNHRLAKWKEDMKDISRRSWWINRKYCASFPCVQFRDQVAVDKRESIQFLTEFTKDLRNQLEWTPEDLTETATELSDFWNAHTRNISVSPPSKEDVVNALKKRGGVAGTDGWTNYELRTIAKCDAIRDEVQEQFLLWQELCLTPTVLRHTKVSLLPKEQAQKSEPKKFRPVTIYSTWWRAWSASWSTSPSLEPLQQVFRKHMSLFSHHGCETLAAAARNLLEQYGYAASLDYSQCYDAISLDMLEAAACKISSYHLKAWPLTLVRHWKSTSRWFSYQRGTAATPFCSATGMPQGDSSAPLVLGLVLTCGAQFVKDNTPGFVYLSQYVDDRLIISDTKEKVEYAIELIDSAKRTAKRVRALPLSNITRVSDLGLFCKGKALYGWRSHLPNGRQCSSYNAALWQGAGRLRYAVPELKTFVGGCQMERRLALMQKQVRIVAQRNAYLQSLGYHTKWDALDTRLEEGLRYCGWYRDGEGWKRDEIGFRFELRETLALANWKKIAHEIREACRWHQYQQLMESKRHEFVGQSLPPYCKSRIAATRKWARANFGAFAMCIGAIKSDMCRAKHDSDCQEHCKYCGMANPNFEHYWMHSAMPAPSDLLTRGFGWPAPDGNVSHSDELWNLLQQFK
eukprot:Skav233606  [mRNA]  locus=scaffold109:145722:148287:+ [translate_table: standard]